jgi:23S rRNA (cytidine1920-2'-O)/16S rRNA (cytidine1409-2'-O)-methyltransferase
MTDVAKGFFRLDLLLVEKGLCPSRNKAQALIGAGKVRVDGRVVDKAGSGFPPDANIELKEPAHPYVSRGGVKLAEALTRFSIDVRGLTCMDVGASTGGFTHCLLMQGATRVYSVDVGYGQLDWHLRNDKRIVLLERTNIRYLPPEALDEPVDLVTIDTSFISLRLVVPAVLPHLRHGGRIAALIKPQFEVGKGKVGRGGIVKDPDLHKDVVDALSRFFQAELGLEIQGSIPSPILGAKGNREFFLSMRYV